MKGYYHFKDQGNNLGGQGLFGSIQLKIHKSCRLNPMDRKPAKWLALETGSPVWTRLAWNRLVPHSSSSEMTCHSTEEEQRRVQ
jgi:hypothetical protein